MKLGGIFENGSRASYVPWFKEFVCDALEKANYQDVSRLTGIPIKTLENFKGFTAKLKLVEDLMKDFESMPEESLQKFRDILKQFSADEIVAAVARFRVQQSNHPEKFFRSEYFLAILRYKREENAKVAYNEAFRAGHEALNQMAAADLKTKNLSQVANKIAAFLAVSAKQTGTSHLLMSIESLCWGLMDFIAIHQLPALWEKVVLEVQHSRDISLRKWQIINEFIHERLGIFFYPRATTSKLSSSAGPVEMQI